MSDGRKREPALVVDRLTKRFGERTAFSEVSFGFAYGEVFRFLGRMGRVRPRRCALSAP
jgi:ABC-type multidrug transport system ATPase subunit